MVFSRASSSRKASSVCGALSRPRAAEDYADALGDCLPIIEWMQSLVERLLLLARLDAGQAELRPEAVDLAALVESCCGPLADRPAEKNVALEIALYVIVAAFVAFFIIEVFLRGDTEEPPPPSGGKPPPGAAPAGAR